ncbi:MAG: hypothetical protein H6819_07315 [Phycisphaerales bacterium]|nr:hypothetical protein [Phycisphaerales bacterium]MCB9857697.1 hypothetical protein [Phycisphaerales bacterium]MCB9864786.1 hypothetical protein [Phycisphaerales bacterium]
MELPQALDSVSARSIDEISGAARAVQANVVTLRVSILRREPDLRLDDIQTPPPGPVRRSRNILLQPETLKTYSTDELLVRLRQVWGEFCALCWLFAHVDPQAPVDFDHLPPGQDHRCITDARAKLEEVQTHLWRLIHEQRRRHDPDALKDPAFQRDAEIAVTQRLKVFGVRVTNATNIQVFHAACEYAGMLAALRWALDDRWAWEGPGIMSLTNGAPARS